MMTTYSMRSTRFDWGQGWGRVKSGEQQVHVCTAYAVETCREWCCCVFTSIASILTRMWNRITILPLRSSGTQSMQRRTDIATSYAVSAYILQSGSVLPRPFQLSGPLCLFLHFFYFFLFFYFYFLFFYLFL